MIVEPQSFRRAPSYAAFDTASPIVITLAAVAFEASGTPILRQDWPPPLHALGESLGGITGWDAIGLGSPVGYPSSFMIAFVRAVLAQIAGSYVAHLATMIGIWLLVASGARSLARRCGAGRLGCAAAMLIATFNSWTYTELVAGHIFVLLAYGGTFWLAAETMRRPSARPIVLVALTLAIAPQIQFLVLDGIVLVIASLRARDARPLLAVASFFALIATTLSLSRSTLVGIPLTLEWENGLSMVPLDTVLLRGYFTQYSVHGDAIAAIAIWTTLACAVVGTLFAKRTLAWAAIVGLTFCADVAVTGTKGPLGLQFAWLIGHVPEIGLFRELYTLLAFSLVGYVGLASFAVARFRPIGFVWALAALAGPIAWIAFPPANWWVPAQTLPHLTIPVLDEQRYALMPAYAPLSLGASGSGIDPNLVAGPGDSTPINEYAGSYPVDAAIGRYLETGDTRGLAALSVGAIVTRPWLDDRSVTPGAVALPIPHWLTATRAAAADVRLRALPMLALSPLPAVGTVLTTLGSGNVQLGDGAPLCAHAESIGCTATPRPVVAPNAFVEASRGWVDARLAFFEAPELAQSYGGALTTTPALALPLRAGEAALVWIDGHLDDASSPRVLQTGRGGWQWIRVPSDVLAVRCSGRCVVAAQMPSIPDLPLEPPPQPATAVAFRSLLPWLITANVAPGESETLRYNVRYNALWHAYAGGHELPHLRIDAAVNGWIVPRRPAKMAVTIVEVGAAITTAFELLVVALFVALGVSALRPRRASDA